MKLEVYNLTNHPICRSHPNTPRHPMRIPHITESLDIPFPAQAHRSPQHYTKVLLLRSAKFADRRPVSATSSRLPLSLSIQLDNYFTEEDDSSSDEIQMQGSTIAAEDDDDGFDFDTWLLMPPSTIIINLAASSSTGTNQKGDAGRNCVGFHQT